MPIFGSSGSLFSGGGRFGGGNTYFNPLTGRMEPPQSQTKPPTPLENQYRTYETAVKQQAGDYDSIMQNYKDLFARANTSQMTMPSPMTAESFNYRPSSDYTSALANLRGLSQSGGYSDSDITNLRERGISPIRSVYAGANRDVDRQRSLQGGFSPNYNAVKAKMAREMSDQMSNAMTNVNAGIAEKVAQNKVGLGGQLAGIAQNESGLQNQIGMRNTDARNQAQMFNMDLPFKVGNFNQNSISQALQGLQGMQGIYGTTPALSSMFGNQALNSAQLQQLISSQNQGNLSRILSQLLSGFGR